MFDPNVKIAYLSKVSVNDKELRFKDLNKIILKPEFLRYTYEQIEGNQGSKTAGVDKINKFHFKNEEEFEKAINELSNDLYNGSYTPLPVRRVEIPKANGGKRPLGIPALKDRIVQSAIKLILEAIYEPNFENTSHGFRPNRSCQTAVNDIVVRKYDWVIEGDIKGCFDNIKHGKLIDILRKRIADEKFIQVISKFLKSGYQMGYGTDGKLPIFVTETGTPQGGIVSPVLANIYLNEFDQFLQPMLKNYDVTKRVKSSAYQYFNNKVGRLSKAISEGKASYRLELKENPDAPRSEGKITPLNSRDEMVQMLRKLKKMRSKYSVDDKNAYFQNKSLGYVRYADDFVILMGNYQKEDAVQLKEKITKWFDENLKLTLSQEKTKITHATKGFTFLGYDILKRPTEKVDGIGFRDGFSKIYVPDSRIKRVEDKIDTILRTHTNHSAFDVILKINKVVTGWSNYFKIANNWNSVASKVDNMIYWKLLNWIGRKHKMSMAKVHQKHVKSGVKAYGKIKSRVVVSVGDKDAILKQCRDQSYENPRSVADKILGNSIKESWHSSDDVDINSDIASALNGSSPSEYFELVNKYGEKCAKCGTTKGPFEIHHTRMVKRNQRKDAKAVIQASKGLPKELRCETCHKEAHPTNRNLK